MPFERFSRKGTSIALGLGALYLFWAGVVVGLREDHIVLLVVCLGMYFATATTRKLITALFFFIVYWVMYDSMRIYPNYNFNFVHIGDLYQLEKTFFGFEYMGKTVTPNEFFATHTTPLLDLLAGLFYLSWVPVPLAFAVWLFFHDKRLLIDFSLAFLLVNVFGIVFYYLFPAAPPWYVELYGFEKNFNIPGNEAGLANFDHLLGIPLFHSMYAKNANVFAAIPSLHAAYPVIVLYFALKNKMKRAGVFFFIICLGIWATAVYTRHHYIIDVLLGILCALMTIFVFEKIILKTKINNWLERYADLIK